MKETRCGAYYHADRQAVMSLALARYNFSTPEIRVLMRCVLGHAISGRTIKRLAKNSGQRLKRGRPRTTPKIFKGDVSSLIELTSNGLEECDGNTLQFFHQTQIQFGLTPRQYLKWVIKFIGRGKCMMRRCLLCDRSFPSRDSGLRHCEKCRVSRKNLITKNNENLFNRFDAL